MNKKINSSIWTLMVSVLLVTILEINKKRTVCTIKGEIYPAMALRKIWLIQNGDTIPTNFISNKFQVDVKPGPYMVWIDAVAPYQDFQYDSIATGDKMEIELGNIQLVQ